SPGASSAVSKAIRCGSMPGHTCSAGVSTSTKSRAAKKTRVAAAIRARAARKSRLRTKRSGRHQASWKPFIAALQDASFDAGLSPLAQDEGQLLWQKESPHPEQASIASASKDA